MWKIASLFWLLVGLGVSDGENWWVRTKTGDRENASTNANVFLHLIDANARNSPALHLDEYIINDFERGAYDLFLANNFEFGDVCWIRIYRDDNGDSPDLYLEWVTVKSDTMQYASKFFINDWVPTQQEERNNNFVKERTPPCNAGTDWYIVTQTGNRENADTNANVYLHLIAPNARNSEAMLLDDVLLNDFRQGATNNFYFPDGVEFYEVCWIRLYHDNSGASPDLFLDWVAVKSNHMALWRNFTVNGWVPTQQEERNNNFVKERTPACSEGDLY